MKIHSVGEDEEYAQSKFVFVIIKVASSSLGREGRYSRFGSSPASPLHDAQNWPTPEHQSSLHDASSTPPEFAVGMVTFRGLAGPFSLLLLVAPRGSCVPL